MNTQNTDRGSVLLSIIVGGLLIVVAGALSITLGGLFGYFVALLYNDLFNAGFDPLLGAMIGSIVSIAVGGEVSNSD